MKQIFILAIILFCCVLFWSAINPYDRFTWFFEVLPAMIGVSFFIVISKWFRFTTLTYCFIYLFFIMMLIGAHYTYSRVPMFSYFSEIFGHTRNNFDKLMHFLQGFVPALVIREYYIRKQIVNIKWIPIMTIITCLSISAMYEIFEWFLAILTNRSAEVFLGMQGYEWDTQSDMLCALLGSIIMILFVSKIQDKQINLHLHY